MLVKYDEIDGFLKKLDTLDKKNVTLFVKPVKQITKQNQIVSNIIVQALDGDKCFQIIFDEDLPVFQLVPDSFWSAITDETLRKQARDGYTDGAKKYDERLETEHKKMVDLLKDKGFTNIENAVLE